MLGAGPIAYEQITVSSSAIGLTLTDRGAATYAEIMVEGQPIRYRVDGTDPTSAVGHLVNAGGVIRCYGRDALRNFRAIRSGITDATLTVTLYRKYVTY